jgi:hypothetical protein
MLSIDDDAAVSRRGAVAGALMATLMATMPTPMTMPKRRRSMPRILLPQLVRLSVLLSRL